MNQAILYDLARQAVMLIILLSAPVLAVTLLLGLVISIFQAVTQIQEATLAFVPKILGVFAVLAIFGPWMLSTLLTFTANLITGLPALVR
jgi:flagellar biosynthetic protein FliQ